MTAAAVPTPAPPARAPAPLTEGLDRPAPRRVAAVAWVRAMVLALGEAGGSEPHVFECNDGRHYMVKAWNNPQGGRVLVHELVGGLALDWLGVVHPPPALVEIPRAVLAAAPGARYRFRGGPAAGLAFGSEFWSFDPGQPLDRIGNLDTRNVAGVCVFDTWIGNREEPRQYRQRACPDGLVRLVPIDQGHAFGYGDLLWTPASLRRDARALRFPPPLVPVTAEDVALFVRRLRGFDQAAAVHLVAQVPASWLTEEERAALAEYLVVRASLAADRLTVAYPDRAPDVPDPDPRPQRRPLALLGAADARRWPRLVLGRQTVGPGELAWRQAVTLATADELAALEGALAGVPVPTSAHEEVR